MELDASEMEVESVWGASMIENQVKFFVKWKRLDNKHNSWVNYDRISSDIVFMSYINNLRKNYEVDIEINSDILRKKLTDKIEDIKSKPLIQIHDILQKNNFDSIKFKAYQLIFHSLAPNETFEKEFEDMFVLNEGNLSATKSEELNRKFILEINKFDRSIDIKIENYRDLGEVPKFTYIGSNIMSKTISAATTKEANSCKCSNECSESSNCCGSLDGRTFPYCNDEKGDGLLVDLTSDRSIIECGESCDCDLFCINRLSQKIRTPRVFKLFKSERYGWSLKTDQMIQKGSYITECTGMLSEKSALKDNLQMSYFFRFKLNENDYVIDAFESGNLARFINHSCNPNSLIRLITDQSNNLKLTRLCVFALRDIEEDNEITVNYDKYSIGCLSSDLKCLCGSLNCNGIIYSTKKLSSSKTTTIKIEDSLQKLTVIPSTSGQSPVIPIVKMAEDDIAVRGGKHIDVASYLLPRLTPTLTEMMQIDVDSDSELKKQLKCSDCDFECPNHKTMRRHKLEVHNIGKVLICYCGFVFITPENYESHKRLVANAKNYVKIAKIIKSLKKENNCSDYQWKHDLHINAPKPADSTLVKAFITHYERNLQQNFQVLNKIQQEYFETKAF